MLKIWSKTRLRSHQIILPGEQGLLRRWFIAGAIQPRNPTRAVRLLTCRFFLLLDSSGFADKAQRAQLVLLHHRSSVVVHAATGSRSARGGPGGGCISVGIACHTGGAAATNPLRLTGHGRCTAHARYIACCSGEHALAGSRAHCSRANRSAGVASAAVHVTNDTRGTWVDLFRATATVGGCSHRLRTEGNAGRSVGVLIGVVLWGLRWRHHAGWTRSRLG